MPDSKPLRFVGVQPVRPDVWDWGRQTVWPEAPWPGEPWSGVLPEPEEPGAGRELEPLAAERW
jgi:hypothetical protein